MADSKRRSARQLAERKRTRSIYFEPDTDDFDEPDNEDDGEAEYRPEPVAGPSRPQRPAKRQKLDRRSKPVTRSKGKQRQNLARRPPSRPQKKRGVNWIPPTPSKSKELAEKSYTGPSDGVIPDWTRLPAELLRQSFVFASRPIHEQTTTAESNALWLKRTALVCRAFAVPALEAFYEHPTLHTTLHPHKLLDLVTRPQEDLYMNYKHRVKSVSIDVERLTYVAYGRRPFQVGVLLQQLPRLQNLEIVHPLDSPPYRQTSRPRPWTYPLNLFAILESAEIRLKSFRWTRSMIPTELSDDIPQMYQWMATVHASKPFEYVERLVVCGYDFKDSALDIPEGAPVRSHGLANTISVLPRLKDLTFISCDVIMEDFLEHVPRNLERLEISNCLEVTSDILYSYLELGGSHLKELVLNHNAALNFAFLQHMKVLCPRLEVLKMDVTYYSERFNFNDAIALYDQLLAENQVPTWPSTLRHVELMQMRKWDASAAQNLFRSLLDSAAGLPDLRHLALQAHISIPWRDRATFRDQWIDRLQRVYLRKQDLPNPSLGSLKQFRLSQKSQVNGKGSNARDAVDSDDARPTRRVLSHVRVTPRKPSSKAMIHSDDDSEHQQLTQKRPRRSVRVAESQSASTVAEEESSPESENESETDWHDQPEAFIQGLCDVVDIRIDNQRPRENQFTEANFLDSELSGDEDYREGAELSDEERYAW